MRRNDLDLQTEGVPMICDSATSCQPRVMISDLTNNGGGSLQRLTPRFSQWYMYDTSWAWYSSGVMLGEEGKRVGKRGEVFGIRKETGKNEIHAFYIRLLVELSSGRGA